MGGRKTINNTADKVAGISLQESTYGKPIPIVWGTSRLAANLLWYGDFNAIPHTTTQSSGGKGGSPKMTNTTYTYQAAVMLGLGEVITDVSRVWINKDRAKMSTAVAASYPAINNALSSLPAWSEPYQIFKGDAGQSPWSYLTSKHPGQDLYYQKTAYVAIAPDDLDGSGALQNHNFEVIGNKVYGNGICDASPRDIITDFLTNQDYGAQWDPARIGDLTQYSNYCVANGLFLSPALTEQRPGADILQEIADSTNTLIVWSEGKLKFVPRGDSTVTGNGVTYTPNLTPVYALTDDDFLTTSSQEPVRMTRKRPSDAYNRVPVEFLDRSNDYNISTVEAYDLSNIYKYGLRKANAKQLHMICDGKIAQAIAQITLQRELYIRNTYEFDLGWQYCLLEPGDIVSITDAGLGLDGLPVMITQVDENEDGDLTITAEEFPFGIHTHASYPTQSNSGYDQTQLVAPGNAAAPVIFQMPITLSKKNILALATAGGVYWGGCEVWVSEDNSTYSKIGTINGGARFGTLLQAISAGSDPDTAHNLVVDLTPSKGVLLSGTQADADAFNTLCYVDGEFISYETATLTATNQYSLSYLRRGVYGSTNGGHSAGTNFVRVDDAVFQYELPARLIGQPLWIKLLSFNVYGKAMQQLSDVNPVNYTPAGSKPLQVASLTVTGGIFTNHIAWTFPAGVHDVDYVEVYQSTTDDRSTATVLTDAKYPRAFFDQGNLSPGQTVYYWARIFDTAGNVSDYYPSSATGGVPGTPSADPSAILAQLNNSITTSQLNQDLATRINKIDAPSAGLTDTVAAHQEQVEAAAEGVLNMLIKMDDALNRQRTIKTKTDATINLDPNTGTVTIIASAPVTTDVEQRLSNVEVEVNANTNEIKSNTSQISTINGTLTSQQTEINQQNATITLKADKTYVDSSIAASMNGVDPTVLNSDMDLLGQALSNAILVLNQARNEGRSAGANFASAQLQIQANADAITAEANARLSLAAIVNENGAAIQNEQTARANADSSMASQISALQTQSNNNTASIQNETNARVSGDQANANSISSLQATLSVNGSQTVTASAFSNLQTTVSNQGGQINTNASSISTLQTSVNGNTSSIQTLQSSVNGLSAEYTLKLDVNGYVSGFGAYNSGTTSELIIRTDSFAIVAPGAAAGSTGTAPFVVGKINGVSTVGINGALVVDGSVTATAMAVKSLAAISANLGSVTMDSTGAIHGGQTDYNTGAGFFLGYSGGYKFSIGDGANNSLTWDGTTLRVKGDLTLKNYTPGNILVHNNQSTVGINSTSSDTKLKSTILPRGGTLTANFLIFANGYASGYLALNGTQVPGSSISVNSGNNNTTASAASPKVNIAVNPGDSLEVWAVLSPGSYTGHVEQLCIYCGTDGLVLESDVS